MKRDLIIIGAGIAGLATALAAARQGMKVTVLERHSRAMGASIRNFGMIWPIGQPDGFPLEMALRSREIWKEITQAAGCWFLENGSFHLAYHEDEWAVLNEFYDEKNSAGYDIELCSSAEVAAKSPAVKTKRLLGALWSKTECLVDAREAIRKLPEFLSEKFNVEFYFNTPVSNVEPGKVFTPQKNFEAEKIFICSGSDFEYFFPDHFKSIPITRCKLQMMRTAPQPSGWRIGPSLCGGLTLGHYGSFAFSRHLTVLKNRFDEEEPRFGQWGIHVLVSQNGMGEVIIGDSHEYGHAPEPFDKAEINRLILKYLHTFFQAPDINIAEQWHGVYAKMTDGQSHYFSEPEPQVYIFNGLGGAGMTLSFGLAEPAIKQVIEKPSLFFQKN